jgi:S-adenosylmethionine:diacylglycerol 3-amino-3-carboxypropyl transferase
MTTPYHYTESGLDYVYLVDGFEVIETAYGPAVQVIQAGKLDRAIAATIVGLQDAQTVARWEKAKTEVPATEDIALRQIYLEMTGHRRTFIDTSRKVARLTQRLSSVMFRTRRLQRGRAVIWSMAA